MIAHSKALTLVKSTQAIVSEFVGVTADPCFTKGIIKTFPTILKNGNSFYLDYSNSTSASDLKYLKKFFSGITSGNTFSISGGTYFVNESGMQYNFTGTYKLEGVLGDYNNFIYLNGICFSGSLFDGTYNSKDFITSLSFSAINGNTAQYFISKVNKEDPFNIEFLGIYGSDYSYEEYVEITGASANTGRYKIQNSLKLNDGSEIIYIDPSETIVSENMYFKNNTVNIYMRGVPDLITLSQNKNANGIIKKLDINGNVLQILENQNLRQKYCRNISDLNNYYDWYASTKLANMQNIYNPVAYDGLSLSINSFSFVKIGTRSENESINFLTGNVNTSSIPVLIVDGVDTAVVSYKIQTYVNDPIIKLDLSDASLVGWKVIPYIDMQLSLPLNNYYFLNGVPGYDGASFIYIKTVNNPSTIFLKFEQNTNLVLTVEM
jgi:glutaredoxin-related protein